MTNIERAYHHFLTITHHKIVVMDLCFKIGMVRQGLLHDLSKYQPEEFMVGVRYWCGTRSPNAIEREKTGYSSAYLHHKGRNKHHYEYWTDLRPRSDEWHYIKVPLRYVLEMICDRIAASKTYHGDEYNDAMPWEFYVARSESRYMHPETRLLLEKLLKMLRDEGEFRTLAYMRWLWKHPSVYDGTVYRG